MIFGKLHPWFWQCVTAISISTLLTISARPDFFLVLADNCVCRWRDVCVAAHLCVCRLYCRRIMCNCMVSRSQLPCRSRRPYLSSVAVRRHRLHTHPHRPCPGGLGPTQLGPSHSRPSRTQNGRRWPAAATYRLRERRRATAGQSHAPGHCRRPITDAEKTHNLDCKDILPSWSGYITIIIISGHLRSRSPTDQLRWPRYLLGGSINKRKSFVFFLLFVVE